MIIGFTSSKLSNIIFICLGNPSGHSAMLQNKYNIFVHVAILVVFKLQLTVWEPQLLCKLVFYLHIEDMGGDKIAASVIMIH